MSRFARAQEELIYWRWRSIGAPIEHNSHDSAARNHCMSPNVISHIKLAVATADCLAFCLAAAAATTTTTISYRLLSAVASERDPRLVAG